MLGKYRKWYKGHSKCSDKKRKRTNLAGSSALKIMAVLKFYENVYCLSAEFPEMKIKPCIYILYNFIDF